MIQQRTRRLNPGEGARLTVEGVSSPAATAEAGLRWGRDLGALRARNSSKGALVVETQAVFRALHAGPGRGGSRSGKKPGAGRPVEAQA